MEKEIRVLIKLIERDKQKGLVLSHSNAIKLQSIWLQLYGAPGCDHYPYTTERDMIDDLNEYLKS